jgi:hypothetical protein
MGALFLPASVPRTGAVAPICRLYLDPHDKFTRVVPLPRVAGESLLTAEAVLSTITVNYSPGFPEAAQIAFQAAVDIWKTQVQTNVPIVIDAKFVDLGSPLLLGEGGPSCSLHDFAGATRANTWFPAAIAERLSGADLTPSSQCPASSSEIATTFNSAYANWYFGTDGVPTSGKVDFVSAVLHELGHGLGFFGLASVVNGIGTVGDSGLPYIYDTSVFDSAGTSILNSSVYPNGSMTMGSLLQGMGVSGSGLFWGGTNGTFANGGARPSLYAPGSFSAGSSYTHLDEATYPAGDLNSLMTPFIGTAEVIHTPGPIVLGMFADMGWGSQTGSSCSFGLDHYVADVLAAGGTVRVELVTAGGCAWTASTTAPFVSGLFPTSGTTSASIQMTVAANPGSGGRTATVTIGTETLTIAQKGSAPCSNSLSPTGVTTGAAGLTGTVALTSATGCAWTAASSDPTVATILTDPPSGQDSATIIYFVSGNTGPSPRSATLTIAGQPFSIAQAGCQYMLDRTSFSVSGGTSSIDVQVAPTAQTCQWTASSSSSFATIAAGASGAGNGVATFAIAPNPTLSPRSTSVTVARQTVTIDQGPGLPTMTLDRTSLDFGATESSSGFVAATTGQTVRLTQSGLPGTVTWTAGSNQPWLQVSPASGTGAGTLTVSVVFDPSLPLPPAAESGSIAIVLNGANGPVGPIQVGLNLFVPSTSGLPIGSFDTPSDGAIGLAGSVAFTGWALQNVQVMRVTICRDPLPSESVTANPTCGGQPEIYVADGVFIDGARPDVRAAFPSVPLNRRGGWGYLMLTNGLPNAGNGTYTFSSWAYDADRHVARLGVKTIACDNAHSIAPFGTIDTPGQGEVVSGVVANYGWVLSPGTRRADPPGGGTVTVFVDGVPVGSPGGWTSRSDLSALFPKSQYDGVDTALGVFGLDTTSLANGVHTIAWSVTDDSGVTTGIGSRFFTVSNGASLRRPVTPQLPLP